MAAKGNESVDDLMDQLLAAAAGDDWRAVAECCERILQVDPGNDAARRFRTLADLRLADTAPRPRRGGVEERRQLTVMFADMVGSTTISRQLEPDRLYKLMGVYQEACSAAVTDWGGFVGNWIGDGMMVYFGYPTPYEDAAYRAAMAGLALVERLEGLRPRFQDEFGVDVQVRVGVHTGLVVVADMGGGDRVQHRDLVGETPNVAARLEGLAPPGGIVVSAATLDLIRGFVEVEPLGAREVKGVDEPMDVYRVLAPTHSSRYHAWRSERSALVGRRRELDQLVAAVSEADAERGVLVAVVGEPGIGKTRLVDEACARFQPHRSVLTCGCSEMSMAEPLAPFHKGLMAAAGLKPGTRRADAFELVAATLARYVDDPVRVARLVLELGFDVPPEIVLPEQTPEQTLRDVTALYLEWFAGFGRERPAVLVVDDVHWIDSTSTDMLLRLRAESPHLPVIVASRPTGRGASLLEAAAPVIGLEPLSTDETVELLASVVSVGDRTELDVVAERSDGVPLFVEELGRVMNDQGTVALAAIPSTLHDLLTFRLDEAPDAKRTAQVAATIGRDFDTVVLEHLVGPATLNRDLPVLVDAGIVVTSPRPGRLRFRHALLADAAYDSQLRDRKEAVHLEVADALVAAFPDLLRTAPHRVAAHLEAGGRLADAAGLWLQAGMVTAGRGAHVEATEHFGRGLSLLDRLEPGPLALQLELGLQLGLGSSIASTAGYGHERVAAAFERAEELCSELGNPADLFFAVWGSWTFSLVRADYDTAMTLAERCRTMADGVDDPALSIEAAAAQGITAFYRGELAGASVLLDAAVEQYRTERAVSPAQRFQHPAVASLANRALVHWLLGDHPAARAAVVDAVSLAETCEPELRMFARGYAATFGAALGSLMEDGELTLRHAQEAIDVCNQFGSQVFLAGGEMFKGYAQCLLGEPEEGRARLDAAAHGYLLTGARLMRPYHLSRVAEVRRSAGDLPGAMEALDEAVEQGRRSREHAFLPLVLELRARTLLDLGDDREPEATADLDESLALARSTGDVMTQLRALVTGHVRLGRSVTGDLRDLLPALERADDGPELRAARELAG